MEINDHTISTSWDYRNAVFHALVNFECGRCKRITMDAPGVRVGFKPGQQPFSGIPSGCDALASQCRWCSVFNFFKNDMGAFLYYVNPPKA